MSKPKQRAMRLKEVIEQAADGLTLAEIVVSAANAQGEARFAMKFAECLDAARAIVEKAGEK